MDRLLLKALLAVMLTGLFSCSSTDHTSKTGLSDVAPLDDFDKALGLYAQGLLAFENDASEGLRLLEEALRLSPYEKQIVDDFCLYAHKKVNRESKLDSEVSDHVTLHSLLIKCMSETLLKYPDASYLRLRLVESYTALDRLQEAYRLLNDKNLVEDGSIYLARLRYMRAVRSSALADELKRVFVHEKFNQDINLHLTAIQYLIELGPENHRSQLREHAGSIIHLLPSLPAKIPRATTMALIDAILYSSDLGASARDQSISNLDYTDVRAQWSLLAGILMKLDMYEEAYLVIKHRVLTYSDSPWRATVNLALCCQKMGRNKERLKYLEQAFLLKPESIYTQKSLLVAHAAYGDPERALQIYSKVGDEDDFWMQKIYFYILKDAKKYGTAFKVAERLFNWPDPGERITGINASLASSIVPVYLKMGKPGLLEERIKQSMRYLPDNMSFLNSLAYHYAVEGYKLEQAEKWMEEVYSKDQVTSAYADTFAWVCFKQGKFEEAKKHIDKALSLGKDISAEIFLHAGDIYEKLGYGKDAVKFWQKGLEQDSKYNDELKARLKNKE